jgi:ATP-dependent Zn protease
MPANAAALLAAKEDAAAVTQAHFERVLEQQLMGGGSVTGKAAMNPAERHRIAVHEAGHALVAKLLQVGIVEKVSILKRGRALGVTLVTEDRDVTLQSEAQVKARMTMLLGGRAAEALVLDSISTGAANDLEHVSSMAYRMVTEFGFSKNIGPFSYAGSAGPRTPYRRSSRGDSRGARDRKGAGVGMRCAALGAPAGAGAPDGRAARARGGERRGGGRLPCRGRKGRRLRSRRS